ncbi:MAG: GlsB/YeaQ/YmgE family stress response membrane protein [Candidatus Rokuibacteriota bacterium]
MNPLMFILWVLVGLLAGWLAGFAMKRGGYGLQQDIILGVAGSIVASGIFWTLGGSPEANIVPTAVVAFVGAAIPIVAQRKIWPTIA